MNLKRVKNKGLTLLQLMFGIVFTITLILILTVLGFMACVGSKYGPPVVDKVDKALGIDQEEIDENNYWHFDGYSVQESGSFDDDFSVSFYWEQ